MDVGKSLLIQQFNANDDRVRIIKWLVNDKEYVEYSQPILVVETSKTNIEIESESSGYIHQHFHEEDIISTGSCYAKIFSSLEELESSQLKDKKELENNIENLFEEGMPNFSKAAIEIINKNNIDATKFNGLGFVTKEIVNELLQKEINKNDECSIDTNIFPNAKVEALTFIKKTEIIALKKYKSQIVSSSLSVQFETHEIRKKISSIPWLNRSLLSYIIYNFSKLLSKNPKFTSFIDNEYIHMYNRVNIGLAIDLGKGLKVMVINDADKITLSELHMNIIEAISCYHEESIKLDMLQNSTVTVSDLSSDNIIYFNPILNTNQSIILGIGGDQNIYGQPMTLTIAFDHCILSGQEVAFFLKELKHNILNDYYKLLI